ncbi:hypothetical protein GCM10020358_24250 [Amorphoplanes nipponensis]
MASLVAAPGVRGKSAPVPRESPWRTPPRSVPARAGRPCFAFGPRRDRGARVFTHGHHRDRRLADGATDQAQLDLMRIPRDRAGPERGADADTESARSQCGRRASAPGRWNGRCRAGPRQLEWIAGGTRYVLAANAYSTDARSRRTARTEDDLRWLVERTIKR